MTTRSPMHVAVLLCASLAVAAQGAEPVAMSGDLPDETVVREALRSAPRLQAASELRSQGNARQQRLDAGPHEWELQALTQRRKDAQGITRSEQEYGVQRGVRWPWKRDLDRRIGALAAQSGELGYLDAWHEAGRDLLDLWFDWARNLELARLGARQLELGEAQRDAVARRMAAGDAANLDLQLAEAEVLRLRAARSQADRDAALARESLRQEFPALPPAPPQLRGAPGALPGTDDAWIARIVSENHEVELAAAARDEAQLAARRAARERLADPVLGLTFSDNLDGDRRVIGLSFSLPLGGAGRSADAALALSEARRTEAEWRRTADRVEAMARAIVADARSSHDSWGQQREAVDLQSAAVDALARGYAAGEFDVAVLLAARRAAMDAERELLDARVRAGWSAARLLLDAHQIWTPGNEAPGMPD